jgi:hypothetical protein
MSGKENYAVQSLDSALHGRVRAYPDVTRPLSSAMFSASPRLAIGHHRAQLNGRWWAVSGTPEGRRSSDSPFRLVRIEDVDRHHQRPTTGCTVLRQLRSSYGERQYTVQDFKVTPGLPNPLRMLILGLGRHLGKL